MSFIDLNDNRGSQGSQGIPGPSGNLSGSLLNNFWNTSGFYNTLGSGSTNIGSIPFTFVDSQFTAIDIRYYYAQYTNSAMIGTYDQSVQVFMTGSTLSIIGSPTVENRLPAGSGAVVSTPVASGSNLSLYAESNIATGSIAWIAQYHSGIKRFNSNPGVSPLVYT